MSDGQRNIVLLTYDSLRADHCGYMGCERDTTPNLDRLADEGVAFENAISPAPRTNPSMAGVFTGEPMAFREEVSNPEISRRHLKRYGTIAEHLSEMGYTTGAFNPNAYASQYYGFDRGFDHYEDFLFSEDTYQTIFDRHLDDTGLYRSLRNIRNFVRGEEVFRTWDTFIDDIEQWVNKADEPYFLWIFSMDTHFPYRTPSVKRKYSNLLTQFSANWKRNKIIDQLNPELSEKFHDDIVDIYDDAIRFGDTLLSELSARIGETNPSIVVHGDHGEALGEQGMYGHFYPSLFEENIHVPLVIYNSQFGTDRVDEPFPLTRLPSLLRAISRDKEYNLKSSNVAISSDFDGRRDRNIISARSGDYKFMLEETKDKQATGFYRVNTSQLSRDVSVEEGPDSLRLVAKRRNSHESEIVNITKAMQNLN